MCLRSHFKLQEDSRGCLLKISKKKEKWQCRMAFLLGSIPIRLLCFTHSPILRFNRKEGWRKNRERERIKKVESRRYPVEKFWQEKHSCMLKAPLLGVPRWMVLKSTFDCTRCTNVTIVRRKRGRGWLRERERVCVCVCGRIVSKWSEL